jgi:hypothetical protein
MAFSVDGSNRHSPHSTASGEVATESELMAIQITVYSLSGILNIRSQSIGSHPKNRNRSPRKNSIAKKSLRSDERSVSSSLSSQSLDVPVTAVVAVANEKVRTYSPSLPLARGETTDNANTSRYTAYWREDGCPALKSLGDNCGTHQCTTFEISRVMMREPFRRGTAIAQVSHYVCEKVDLNIAIGRGKSIISLGVASILISGDDDGEIMMLVPVKLHTGTLSDGKHAFASESSLYTLAENASLRIGIRVFPQHMKDRMPEKGDFYLDCDSDDTHSQGVIVHIDDAHSMIKELYFTSPEHALYTDEGRPYYAEMEPSDELPDATGKVVLCGVLPCILFHNS